MINPASQWDKCQRIWRHLLTSSVTFYEDLSRSWPSLFAHIWLQSFVSPPKKKIMLIHVSEIYMAHKNSTSFFQKTHYFYNNLSTKLKIGKVKNKQLANERKAHQIFFSTFDSDRDNHDVTFPRVQCDLRKVPGSYLPTVYSDQGELKDIVHLKCWRVCLPNYIHGSSWKREIRWTLGEPRLPQSQLHVSKMETMRTVLTVSRALRRTERADTAELALRSSPTAGGNAHTHLFSESPRTCAWLSSWMLIWPTVKAKKLLWRVFQFLSLWNGWPEPISVILPFSKRVSKRKWMFSDIVMC